MDIISPSEGLVAGSIPAGDATRPEEPETLTEDFRFCFWEGTALGGSQNTDRGKETPAES